MASYRFVSTKTNLAVLLPQVDDEVCAFYGDPPHPTNNHPCYVTLVEVGMGILLMSGQGSVNKESFDAWVEQRLKLMKDIDLADPKWVRHVEMFRKFLYQDYQFEAWR
jgi:hypothetical protein